MSIDVSSEDVDDNFKVIGLLINGKVSAFFFLLEGQTQYKYIRRDVLAKSHSEIGSYLRISRGHIHSNPFF